MRRDTLALVVIALCCGCQTQGRTTNDPFWGRTRVPPPATGAAGNPGVDPYYNRQPAPLGPQSLPPGATTPTGVPPVTGGATYNYPVANSSSTAAIPSPASPGFSRPAMTSNGTYPGANFSGSTYGSPATSNYGTANTTPQTSTYAMPVSGTPQSPSPQSPSPQSPYSVPNYSAPINSLPPSPASPPTGTGAPPGYLPPSGMNYQGSTSKPGSTWTAAGTSDPNVTQASASVPSDSGMDTTPSVIRIPDAAQSANGVGGR